MRNPYIGIYIYMYIPPLASTSPFPPTSWTPTCVPCVKHAVETGDKCEYLHQFDPNRMPECTTFLKVMTRPWVFAMDFFVGDLGDLQYENHRWWVVNWYNKSDVSRYSDVSLLFSCTALNIARHEPLLEANHVFYIV